MTAETPNNKWRRYTHRGWYCFCPVYLGFDDDTMWMEERHRILKPLFVLAHAVQAIVASALSVLSPEWEPGFLVTHVTKLEQEVRK